MGKPTNIKFWWLKANREYLKPLIPNSQIARAARNLETKYKINENQLFGLERNGQSTSRSDFLSGPWSNFCALSSYIWHKSVTIEVTSLMRWDSKGPKCFKIQTVDQKMPHTLFIKWTELKTNADYFFLYICHTLNTNITFH